MSLYPGFADSPSQPGLPLLSAAWGEGQREPQAQKSTFSLAPLTFGGSSDFRWGSWGEAAGGEEHAEAVVVPVSVAAGEAAVELDDPVHRLGAAVR